MSNVLNSPEPNARAKLSRGEQTDLVSLVKQRAKVAKADAIARGVQLVADFETQLNAEYSFDQSAIWEAAMRSAATAVTDANDRVKKECERLGIPAEFSPEIKMGWASQGQQASEARQRELRRLARVHIDASIKTACADIERASVTAQTDLVASGLSDTASAFLSRMPSIEAMLPRVQVATIKTLLATTKENRLNSMSLLDD